VTALAFSPPGASLRHQIDGATTTPGRARSVTSALATNAPRSLCTFTLVPSTMRRGAASSGWISRRGERSSATNDGRFANDELRKLRAGGDMKASG
jgi:hypothetical protein